MRFYVSPEYIFPEKNIIEIRDRAELHHICDVMRLKKDADVTIFDGLGMEYSGRIKDLNRNLAMIEIKSKATAKKDTICEVTLYQALPKKNKMDLIVEKAVELGVEAIVPVITERTVPVIEDKARSRLERWKRIAKEASKQCGRTKLPRIYDVTDFKSALAESNKSDVVIFAALDNEALTLKEILKDCCSKHVAVFVGPEGDFSKEEVSMAKKTGCAICSLGPLVLRVETACMYILSCLNYNCKN